LGKLLPGLFDKRLS